MASQDEERRYGEEYDDEEPEEGYERAWHAGPSNVIINTPTGSYPVHYSSAARGRPGEPRNPATAQGRRPRAPPSIPSVAAATTASSRRDMRIPPGSTGRGPHADPPRTPPSIRRARGQPITDDEDEGSEDNEMASMAAGAGSQAGYSASSASTASRQARPQRGNIQAALQDQHLYRGNERPVIHGSPQLNAPPLNLPPIDPATGTEILYTHPVSDGIIQTVQQMMGGMHYGDLVITDHDGERAVRFAAYVEQ